MSGVDVMVRVRAWVTWVAAEMVLVLPRPWGVVVTIVIIGFPEPPEALII